MGPALTPDEIRAARIRLGLTQATLAQRIGVSVATVNKWERGHTKPHRVFLQLLKKELAPMAAWLRPPK